MGHATTPFSTIDLTFAPDSSVTFAAAQVQGLTRPDRELIVKSDSKDMLSATRG